MVAHSARILGLLLELEPQLLQNKRAAANVLIDLADVAGIVAAIILLESGEVTFQELLLDITRLMDESAHEIADLHPNEGDGSSAIN
jgi:hypothetical protein